MTDEVYVSANDAIGFNVYDRSTLNGSGQLMLNYDVWGDDGNDKGAYISICGSVIILVVYHLSEIGSLWFLKFVHSNIIVCTPAFKRLFLLITNQFQSR